MNPNMTPLKLCLRLFVAVAFLTSGVSGSKINLTASTASIRPLLTPALNLRCALEDTASSSTLVGRSVASTANNAKFVISIFLFRNDEDIASLSEHVPARAVLNTPNLNVSGSIPGGQGESGFLEISLAYPTDSQGGHYTCQVTAIDDIGHTVVYSASVDIDVTTPTINDMLHHIQTQDQRNTAAFKSQEINHKADIASLKSQDLKSEAKIQTLTSQVNQLQTELNDSRHIEGGVVDCGGKLGYAYPLSRSQSVTFTTPYGSDPMVHLAVFDAGITNNYDAYFDVKLVKTDTSGFTVECSMRDSGNYLAYLKVFWLSFP